MALLVVLFVLSVVVPIAAGIWAHRRGWSLAGGPVAWGSAAAERFGQIGAVFLIVIVGWGSTVAVGLALGFLAKSMQSGVDEPVFHWVHSRVPANGFFTTLNGKLTLMGYNANTQLVVFVAAVILAFVYKRRWYIPPVALLVAYYGEKYLQKFLGKVVDRGHPPTTQGTYPSGGVARILAVYAVVVILVLLVQPTLSRAWRAGLWTGVVTAGVVEAYTRVYLSKHWFTDAAFALVFGALLLLTNVTAVSAAVGARAEEPRIEPAPERVAA